MKSMSKMMLSAFLGLTTLACLAQTKTQMRQTYALDKAKTSSNAVKVADDLKKGAPEWKNTPFVYYTVSAMSDIRRLPDSYPADGKFGGTLEYIAAQNEYEAASFVLYAMKNVDKLDVRVSDLKSKSGAVIPASSLDVKIVKVWYQAGSGWYGYFADALGRELVPELLVNDENIVIADPATKDNYLLYKNSDGSERYFWASANFMVTNYSFANQVNSALLADADKLQSAVLNKDEFKQFFVTFHAPKNAKEGIYKGKIDLVADGKTIGSIPVAARVLPFELPAPKTNYNIDKGFYLCLYGTDTKNTAILKNLARHNGHPMGMPNVNTFVPERLEKDVKIMEESGLATRPIFSGTAGAGITVGAEPSGEDLKRIADFKRQIMETAELTKKVLGHTDFYSYGVDEGGPGTIRAERLAWKTAHDAGGKVMVTSYPWKKLLYALDYLIIPGAPTPKRMAEVDKFHESNPDALLGWYANPHTGPENPDYFRRIHGYEAWKSNYDVSSNYCWWRNNWNDMATPYEPNLRGLVSVYATRDNVIDTLAWEGMREGMDDVRYATYLKQLAYEALKSKNGEVHLMGRKALSFLTYSDQQRDAIDATRLEIIDQILQLRKALEGEKK